MAQRRMLSKKIIDTDAFMDMPLSTQALYMHLVINADDEGFIGNPNRIMRTIGCSPDDKKILLAKRFVLDFESGVLVIKHWYIHNLIRIDRKTETTYKKEKAELCFNNNKAYTELNNGTKPIVIPNDNRLTPQVSIVEVSIVEDKEVLIVEEEVAKKDKIPYQEILDYLNLKTKKNYKDSETNKKYIRTRWNKDKMRLDDFFKCIDNTYLFRMDESGDLSQMKPSVIFNGEMEARVSGDHYSWYWNKKEKTSSNPKKDWTGRYGKGE